MKTIITILTSIASLSFFSCANEQKIKGDWIVMYQDTKYQNSLSASHIWSFDGDEIGIKSFAWEWMGKPLANEVQKGSVSYKKEGRFIYIKGQESDTITSRLMVKNVKTNLMELSEIGNASRKIILTRLLRFNQKKNIEKFKKLLNDNTCQLILSDKTLSNKVEHLDNHSILGIDFPVRERWKIDTYKDELFLVFSFYQTLVYQVTSISGTLISLRPFTKDGNISYKLEPIQEFDSDKLIGTWREDISLYNKKTIPLPPVTAFEDKKGDKFSPEHLLIFSDSTYYRKQAYNSSQKAYWRTNRTGEVLFFSKTAMKYGYDINRLRMTMSSNDTLMITTNGHRNLDNTKAMDDSPKTYTFIKKE